MKDVNEELLEHLTILYGPAQARKTIDKLLNIVSSYQSHIAPQNPSFNDLSRALISQKDSILITYGDMVQRHSTPPLQVLGQFLYRNLRELVSTVHILPFYPYSSDDGFSILDYKVVNPALGSWEDVGEIGRHFRLMFDAVINHISAESDWFQAYLAEEPEFNDYFIAVDEKNDFSEVFRPRDLPLITRVLGKSGPKSVWTTFSADQVDLNYSNPEVLLAIVDILLFYVSNGAEFIRLDAIAFLWKEEGTASINLPQTHQIIQILRLALDMAAPHVSIITETNVPHEQNISYFGDGSNEAQLVYNFSLPPLVLHAFHSGDARKLSNWSSRLETPSDKTFFLNFLASHDGIGLMPARGILDETEIEELARKVEELGGFVSYRANPDGSKSPYELNINYLDALADSEEPAQDLELISRRFLTSQAIMLAIKGVPGIYFHSMFGSRGWIEEVKKTGLARTINRQKLNVENLYADLSSSGSLRSLVFLGYKRLLRARRSWAAFHPLAHQSIVTIHPSAFACLRSSIDGKKKFLGIHNVSGDEIHINLTSASLGEELPDPLYDLLREERVDLAAVGGIELSLPPYDMLWLGWPLES